MTKVSKVTKKRKEAKAKAVKQNVEKTIKKQKKKAAKEASGVKEVRITKPNLRFSMRIDKKVTSITLKTDMVALFILFTVKGADGTEDYDKIKSIVNEFVYACLAKWDKNDGKGLSEFIANRMVRAILDKSDFKTYRKLVKTLISE